MPERQYKSRRLNVAVTDLEMQKLRDLAERNGTTISELVRQSLKTGLYLQQRMSQGDEVYYRTNRNGELTQIVDPTITPLDLNPEG